jgi:thioester reductase-like protein
MAENHFTCTLGQAKRCPKTKADSIPEFLELQANQFGERPAVGFAGLAKNAACILNFHELNEQTKEAARGLTSLVPKLKESLGRGRTAALLAHSNTVFLTAWLGLIRLGFSVLLLAPQLDKASMEHLCEEKDVEYLFHDSDHANTAVEIKGLISEHLDSDRLTREINDDPEVEFQLGPQGKVSLVPYFHHSSGTSSGSPKAVPQSNAGAFAALPSIDRSTGAATFSATPLYHGGVADCFRSWTSGQMIWLFPGGQRPITPQTVLTCLSAAEEFCSSGSIPSVKYFSSVPYVLKDLAANEEGMATLRQMDMVGAGGAAFPSALGQELVSQGVKLVSRYGSAECGFLLSSDRDFQNDNEWDYLRSDTGSEYLCFEPHVSGLFELVVKPGWPHMAKTNRMDGSYATADLFEKHPTKPNAWRYHSRADAQITLVNGKKFDPEPIESAIASRCPSDLVLDVLIFGDGKSYPGALIFARNGQDLTSRYLLDRIWPIIYEVNQCTPRHAHLSKDMLKVMFYENEEIPPLEKSSKGTTLRQKAHERYLVQMNQTYDEQSIGPDVQCSINNHSDLVTAIARLVWKITGRSLANDDDFFEQGIDSVACIQIQIAIQKLIASTPHQSKDDLDKSSNKKLWRRQPNGVLAPTLLDNIGELPTNLLYQFGTIGGVAEYLFGQPTSGQGDDLCFMLDFAQKYGHFDLPNSPTADAPKTDKRGLVFLLTGATGTLGTHLLDLLRSRPDVEQIYCLLRASDPYVAHQRVDKALKSKAKEGLQPIGTVDKVVCLPCNLAQTDLGLEKSVLQVITPIVDIIIHAAWAVNFTLRLKSFEFHLAGVQNLLSVGLAAAQSSHPHSLDKDLQKRPVKFMFCSSIASVSCSSSVFVPEKLSEEPSDASPLGYSRSKWVAESVCANAHRTAQEKGISLDVEVLRIGQLCGDNEDGIWNKTEAWPLLLSTFDLVGCLPDVPGERLDWLPLDIAASAICEIAFDDAVTESSRAEAPVYHILNPHTTPTWAEMLFWLQEKEGGHLRVVNSAEWLDLLDKCLGKDHPNHPSRKLLSWWKDTFLSRREDRDTKPEFEVAKAAGISDNIRSVRPLSRELLEKVWIWIRRSIPADGKGAES